MNATPENRADPSESIKDQMNEKRKPAAANGGLFDIRVVRWRPYEKGSLRGFLSVSLAQKIQINDLKLFDGNGSRSIELPDKAYKKHDGSTAYSPIVEFDSRTVEREFKDAVLAALDHHLQEAGDAQRCR